jgi:hypothetical protein
MRDLSVRERVARSPRRSLRRRRKMRSRHLLRGHERARDHIAPLTNREPPCTVVVVSGASIKSVFSNRDGDDPRNRARIESGNSERVGAGTIRAQIATNTDVFVNGPPHHSRHLRTVRAAIPVLRRISDAPLTSTAIALAITTAAPT